MSDNTTSSLPPLYQHLHHRRSTAYLATTLLGLLLPHTVCTIFIIARIWTRFLIPRKWHIDDTLTIAAWLCSTAVCVVYSMSIVKPNGSLLNDYILHTYIGLVCYQLSLCLTQLSVLSLCLRVVQNRRLVWITIAAVAAYNIPLLWMSVMQCYPAASSSPQLFGRPVAFCFTFKPLLIASTSLHVATYVWLIGLAAPMVFNRDSLPRRLRWVLVGIFSLSVFVVAAGLARLLLSLHAHQGRYFLFMTILECDIAIICASAVSLRPLLVRFIPRLDLDDESNNLASSTPRYRDSTARRGIVCPRMSIYNLRQHSGSGDLTSVVSYHGYPWTQNHTPARSKTIVAVSAGGQASSGVLTTDSTALQATVVPSLKQPPPALSSLQPSTAAPSDPPPGTLTRRPSSTFFDTADFAQYFPECTPPPKISAKCSAKGKPAAIGLGISLARHGKSRNRDSTGSQESFVMGLNDPASPTRLTRLTRVSGYSGETYTAGGCDEDELRKKSKGDEYVAKTEGQAVKSSKNMETSFLDDTDSDGDTEAAEAKEAKEDTLKKSRV